MLNLNTALHLQNKLLIWIVYRAHSGIKEPNLYDHVWFVDGRVEACKWLISAKYKD